MLRKAAEESFTHSLVHSLISGENALVAEVAAWFDPKWILDDYHRALCRAMFRLSSTGVPVNAHSLAEKLVNARPYFHLDLLAFGQWLTQCYGAAHLRYFAIAVHNHHRRSAISNEARGISHEMLIGEEIDPAKWLQRMSSLHVRKLSPDQALTLPEALSTAATFTALDSWSKLVTQIYKYDVHRLKPLRMIK